MDKKSDSLAPDIGRRVAMRRKQLGLTQAQAAELSGLTQQFFASVETGRKYEGRQYCKSLKSVEYKYGLFAYRYSD